MVTQRIDSEKTGQREYQRLLGNVLEIKYVFVCKC